MNNNENKTSKKPVIIFAAILIAVAGILLAAYLLNRPGGIDGAKNITIDVVVSREVERTFNVATDKEFLGEVLLGEGIAKGVAGQYGLFITEVNGRVVNSDAQEWWCITKGGEEVFTGADSTPIADKDKFELTLMYG